MARVLMPGDEQPETLGALVSRPASFGLTFAGLETSAPSDFLPPSLNDR
ncbi:hypothetical protein OVA24_02545 [Luteolibacter sp. SL250]|nr:hypothetical protein [Luteolibacter sp. SL250]WAC20259.1 hypothetical protein OVA24_02545 [Luteolibacter sp. SL250]